MLMLDSPPPVSAKLIAAITSVARGPQYPPACRRPVEGGERMPVSGKRGFGSMDETKQREIASKGVPAAHQKGSAHEFSPEEARSAGSKWGKAAHAQESEHEFSSEDTAAVGRKAGGAARPD